MMAIIATIRAPNGVTVHIHDDCMVAKGSAEERRAIEAQRQAAHEILLKWGEKHGVSRQGA